MSWPSVNDTLMAETNRGVVAQLKSAINGWPSAKLTVSPFCRVAGGAASGSNDFSRSGLPALCRHRKLQGSP